MRSDIDIKRDVEDELAFDPDISKTDIAVAVKNGVVTLTGFVRSYAQKMEAERAVKRVSGIVGVANDIEIRLPVLNRRTDPEIARDAVAAIQGVLPYSAEHIRVVVRDGWVTLEGEAEWNYQRERAEEAVRRLRGVKGVTNSIKLHPRVPPTEVKRKIEEAFRRSAEIDASRVTVETEAGVVVSVRAGGGNSVSGWAAPEVGGADRRGCPTRHPSRLRRPSDQRATVELGRFTLTPRGPDDRGQTTAGRAAGQSRRW